jgi:hypothetical protein
MRRDAVHGVVREEARPAFEVAVVETRRVGLVEILDQQAGDDLAWEFG